MPPLAHSTGRNQYAPTTAPSLSDTLGLRSSKPDCLKTGIKPGEWSFRRQGNGGVGSERRNWRRKFSRGDAEKTATNRNQKTKIIKEGRKGNGEKLMIADFTHDIDAATWSKVKRIGLASYPEAYPGAAFVNQPWILASKHKAGGLSVGY